MKKEKKEKLKYGLWKNAGFMIASAFRVKEPMVFFLCVGAALVGVAQNLVGLFITPAIIGAVENHVSLRELLLTILFFVGASMLISAASAYINQNTLCGRITVRMFLMNMILKKNMRTSYANIEDDAFAKSIRQGQRVVMGNGSAAEAIWSTLSGLIKNILCFVIYVWMLTAVEPLLLLVILLTSIAGYLVNKYVTNYRHKNREILVRENDRMQRLYHSARNVETAKDIRIFGLRDWIKEMFDRAMTIDELFEKKAQNTKLIGSVLNLLLTFLRNGIAYAYLIAMVLNDGLSVSEFLLYFSVVGGFSGQMTGILNGFLTMHRYAVDMASYREALEYPEPFTFEEGKALSFDPKGQYEIRLENVSYHYPNSERMILENINLTLHKGEKLALVGLNGAGKTTLIRIMAGLLDPTEGRVLLDGKDIRDYNRRDYYKMFSAIFQDFWGLAGSIAMNVAQTDTDIDYDRVRDCIEKAGLTQKLEALPDGLHTKLCRDVHDDAVMLSGGETQRLMLARALYKEAPFILLDEPTAALDPIAEADMYRKYNEMTKNCSSVYISHRLASTRFCDRVLLLDGSRIAEEGTHEELIAKGGKYAELFAVQSKYYKEAVSDVK